MDLPGHGASPGPALDDVARLGQLAGELIDFLAPGGAVVVGHSLGGAIALWLALERPACVRGLVLVGTGGRLRVRADLLAGFERAAPGAGERFVELSFGPAADRRTLARGRRRLGAPPAVTAADLRAADRFDVLERLGAVRAPTVAVGGADDRLTPPKYSRTLALDIPGADGVIVPGAGHMVMMEAPEAVTAAVRAVVYRSNSRSLG